MKPLLCLVFGLLSMSEALSAQNDIDVLVSRSPGQLLALPDLAVQQVRLDPEGFVVLQVTNGGTAALDVSAEISLLVDGHDQGRFTLSDLGAEAPLQPGQVAEIKTRVLLAGQQRRVLVVVDPDNRIKEENEVHNVFAALLTNDHRDLPRLVIDEVGANSEGVMFFALANIGTATVPAGSLVRARLILNDSFVVSDFIIRVKVLEPMSYQRAWVFPEPPVIIRPPGSEFQVQVIPVSDEVAIDLSTARDRKQVFPQTDEFLAYATILDDPEVLTALNWQSTAGVQSYGEWPEAMKNELASRLRTLTAWNGRLPPAASGDRLRNLGPTDARHIYLDHVAHALWLNRYRFVPTDEPFEAIQLPQLQQLLDSRWLFSYNPSTNRYHLDGGRLPATLSPNPYVPYELLTAILPRVKDYERFPVIYPSLDFTSLVVRLADWIRAYVVIADSAGEARAAGRSERSLGQVLFDVEAKPVVMADAAGVRRLYGGLLRYLNTPLQFGDTSTRLNLSRKIGFAYHQDLTMYDVGRLVDPLAAPSGDAIPSALFFDTEQEYSLRFAAPNLTCVEPNDSHANIDAFASWRLQQTARARRRCNSLGQQRAFNYRQTLINLLHVFVPDGLLIRRCRGTRADIEALLTGPRGYVTPFYQTRNETILENAYLAKGLSLNSAREAARIMVRDPERARDTVVATVDARIVSEGLEPGAMLADGDWDQGCRQVEARWQRFVNGRGAAWKSSENGSNQ